MKTLKTLLTAFAAFLALGSAHAADWELWPDKTQMPPVDQLVGLPIIPTGENIATIWVDLGDKTLEKEDKQYKALQFTRDREFTATVAVGAYLIGLLGTLSPANTVDVVASTASWNMVSVEIDGTSIPIERSYLAFLKDFPVPGLDLGFYNVFPRFNAPGTHTYVERFKPEESFFFIEPWEQDAAFADVLGPQEDPWPEFEGRYVYVPEQVGDPVDGYIVYKYTLTVVEEPTAVAPSTWGEVKAAH